MPLNLETIKLNANQGAYGILGKEYVLALIEAVEALAAERKSVLPQIFEHYESDEITCACGFQSQDPDYETATYRLRLHIYDSEQFVFNSHQRIKERADKALEAFDLPSS